MSEVQRIPKDIDQYIKLFPVEIQSILEKVRQIIRATAPDVEEKISYQIQTYALKGNLVHFAAYKNHVGFYPTPSGIDAFKEELSKYEVSKGSVKYPLDKPIPYDLIGRIVRFRVKENLERANIKKKSKQ